jgi:hypothetical protein
MCHLIEVDDKFDELPAIEGGGDPVAGRLAVGRVDLAGRGPPGSHQHPRHGQ